MNLLTPEIRAALLANMLARRNAQAQGEREPDPVPVVRFFNPLGAATWLATELDEDDILFGLADLGLGCPELGSFRCENCSRCACRSALVSSGISSSTLRCPYRPMSRQPVRPVRSWELKSC